MKSSHLDRIFNVVRSRAERVIIADPASDELFVVMPFTEYEMLAGTTQTMGRCDDDDDSGQEESVAQVRSSFAQYDHGIRSRKDQVPARTPAVTGEKEQLEFSNDSWKMGWESKYLEESFEDAVIPFTDEGDKFSSAHDEEDDGEEASSDELNEEERFYIEPLE